MSKFLGKLSAINITISVLTIVVAFFIGFYIEVWKLNHVYEKNFKSYWELSFSASDIKEKKYQLDRFISALEHSNLKGTYNAVWLKTPENSFDENFKSLKSLQNRLNKIINLNPLSESYQLAMQQITSQEQVLKNSRLNHIKGAWMTNHSILFSESIGVTIAIIGWIFLVFLLCWLIF